MSIGEVTFLQSGSLGQVQEGLSLRVLGPQWRSRAAGANLAGTSVYEWIVCSPAQRLSICPALWGSPGEKHKDCFSLVLGEGLVNTACGFWECGLENSSHLIIDRVVVQQGSGCLACARPWVPVPQKTREAVEHSGPSTPEVKAD